MEPEQIEIRADNVKPDDWLVVGSVCFRVRRVDLNGDKSSLRFTERGVIGGSYLTFDRDDIVVIYRPSPSQPVID